ncbi:MAG TPA: hypothetical protein VIY86_03210, partial [Pirellulaceae bacterium]
MRGQIRVFQSAVCLVVCVAGGVRATTTGLHFDVSPLVACVSVEDAMFSSATPQEELIEARCLVSVLTTDAQPGWLRECLFHFYSPEGHTRVHDYFPKSSLVSDIVGPIRVEQQRDKSQGLEITAGTALESPGHAEISGSAKRRQAYSLAYDLLPPRETLTAVGTLGRGAGVYFKQRQTSQSTLEGAREFVLILQVPKGWRAGYLRLVCQARNVRHAGDANPQLAASASFLIPLFAAGDVEAQA